MRDEPCGPNPLARLRAGPRTPRADRPASPALTSARFVCDHTTAPDLVDTPIWAFHHEIDYNNPTIGTQTMYGLITGDNSGTRMRFTLLTFDTGGACDQAHFQTPSAAWDEEPGLFEWIFGQVNDRLD